MRVIVTGASRGIGRAIAQAVAGPGTTVGIGYATSREGAEETAKLVTDAGARALFVPADVGDAPAVERAFAAFAETAMLEATRAMAEDEIVARIPARRIARPEEIARMARLLLSDDASYVNGAIVDVDGGYAVG